MSFQNIIGNEHIKDLLINTAKSENILHSYMFVGADGIGKCLFAKEFAKLVLNVSTDLANHPDFMLIEPEDGKNIKIEQIRYLQEKITEKPISSNKKFYIIDNSDCMTKEAQNCLLKTLEEPPEYAIIVLVLSNINKLLNTIKSRCTSIVFNNLNESEMTKYFSDNNIDIPSSNILKLCDGSIKRAITLQDELESYKQIDDIIDNLPKKDIIDIWKNSSVLYDSKDNINYLLEYMNILLMDKLKITKDTKYINCIQAVEKTKNRLSYNANYDMSIDNLLLKIWEEFHEEYNWS